MKKQITFLFLAIFFIGMTSALDLTAGECSTIDFPNEDSVSIEIIGNSSDMEGFSWTKNLTIIEYCFDLDYKPDNFTIRWFNEEEVFVESSGGGSSGGGSRYFSKSTTTIEEDNSTDVNEIEEPEETIEDVQEEIKEPIFKSKESAYMFGLFVVFIVVAIILFIMKFIELKKAERRLENYE